MILCCECFIAKIEYKFLFTQRNKTVIWITFLQTGLISKEDGRMFSDLFDRRQTGDYDDFIFYEEETVKIFYHEAEVFIQRIITLIDQP